jgi:hypothetical protein
MLIDGVVDDPLHVAFVIANLEIEAETVGGHWLSFNAVEKY